MNTLLMITLAVALPVYALLWHNQPARTQRDKTSAIEAAFTLLLSPHWATRIAALVRHWAASKILKPLTKFGAQFSEPAVSPTFKSAKRGNCGNPADLEIRDTADLEVGATFKAFFTSFIPTRWQTAKLHAHGRTKI
jgi:hypothetical protein